MCDFVWSKRDLKTDVSAIQQCRSATQRVPSAVLWRGTTIVRALPRNVYIAVGLHPTCTAAIKPVKHLIVLDKNRRNNSGSWLKFHGQKNDRNYALPPDD